MTPKSFTQICSSLQFSHVAVLKKKSFHFKIPDGRVALFHLNNFPYKSQNPLRSCQMLMAIRIRSLLETTLLSLVLSFLPPTCIHQTHFWAFPRIYSIGKNLLLIYGCRIFPNGMDTRLFTSVTLSLIPWPLCHFALLDTVSILKAQRPWHDEMAMPCCYGDSAAGQVVTGWFFSAGIFATITLLGVN